MIISPPWRLNAITSASSLLPHKVTYPQVIEIRMWASLRAMVLPITDPTPNPEDFSELEN